MELGTLVAGSLPVGTESSEILCGSRDDVIVENEGAKHGLDIQALCAHA
jgi:hypothetical protein